MFMTVGFPWPVPSAHDQLAWSEPPGDDLKLFSDARLSSARCNDHAVEDTSEHQARRAEELIHWTGLERLRFQWYRLRLTIFDISHPRGGTSEPHARLP